MKVIQVKRGFLKDCVVLESNEFDECWFDTILGVKHFWTGTGDKVCVGFPKRKHVEIGDTFKLGEIISMCPFQAHLNFSWDWDE